jgi:hypothetical protein
MDRNRDPMSYPVCFLQIAVASKRVAIITRVLYVLRETGHIRSNFCREYYATALSARGLPPASDAKLINTDQEVAEGSS